MRMNAQRRSHMHKHACTAEWACGEMPYISTPITMLYLPVVLQLIPQEASITSQKGGRDVEVNNAHSCTHTNRHWQYRLSTTEDRGVEGVHTGGVNRACGDSRVVGGSAGSRSCAAERKDSQFRFAADPLRNSSLSKMRLVSSWRAD